MLELPESLKIFFKSFFVSFGSFSTIEIAFAIAPRLPFFKSESKSTIKYNLEGTIKTLNLI